MKTLGAKMIGLLVAAFILCSAFRADKPVVTVFMIGDSTMANKKLDGGNPERGWGMVLPGFFSEDIRIDNHAANGRSSRSFISEGPFMMFFLWIPANENLYLQLQFLQSCRNFPFPAPRNCKTAKTAGCNRASSVAVQG